jgi:hypothetical protein
MPDDEHHPIGAILDTNSSGRFDVLIYDAGCSQGT